jgi:hypothetical protein
MATAIFAETLGNPQCFACTILKYQIYTQNSNNENLRTKTLPKLRMQNLLTNIVSQFEFGVSQDQKKKKKPYPLSQTVKANYMWLSININFI